VTTRPASVPAKPPTMIHKMIWPIFITWMLNYAKFYRKMIAVIRIALLVAGITRTSRADDGRDFTDKSRFTKIDVPAAWISTSTAQCYEDLDGGCVSIPLRHFLFDAFRKASVRSRTHRTKSGRCIASRKRSSK
jgi:hypothetical protein